VCGLSLPLRLNARTVTGALCYFRGESSAGFSLSRPRNCYCYNMCLGCTGQRTLCLVTHAISVCANSCYCCGLRSTMHLWGLPSFLPPEQQRSVLCMELLVLCTALLSSRGLCTSRLSTTTPGTTYRCHVDACPPCYYEGRDVVLV